MAQSAANPIEPNAGRFAAILTLCALLSALTGCGGSSSSAGSSLVGGGQDPDPVIQDFPVAYIKRPLVVDEDGNLLEFDVREPAVFSPGAELFIRDRASPSSLEMSITAGVFPADDDGNPPQYDIKDLSTSADGMRLVFAMRAPEDPNLDDDEQPTWNIWLYERMTGELTRVIQSDITAEVGQDIAPRFLPDDRIIFASTRQRQAKAILLDENKPQFENLDEDRDNPAFVLHVMKDDGTEIQQVTFNQSNDIDPYVLDNGRVVFSRWDNVANVDRISLYSMLPDGRDLQLLYGPHSHDTGPNGERIEFVRPQEMMDGRLLVMLKTADDQAHFGGLPIAIDAASFIDQNQAVASALGLIGPAQEQLISGDLQIDDAPSPRGRYASVTPLFDGTDRLLVTWAQCQVFDPLSLDPDNPDITPCTDELLTDPDVVEAPPRYGVWMHQLAENTQQPILIPEFGEAYTDVVVFEPKILPAVILDGAPGIDLDPDLVSESVGTLHIKSVYDFDGVDVAGIEQIRNPAATAAADRPARFVRFVKAVSFPDEDILDLDNTAFGRSNQQLMRDVLGYAEVHPDGSVKASLPANVPFAISVLDANGRRITPRHQNWIQLRPGEEKECTGCHTPASELPHGRLDAEPASANPGAPVDGSPFPNTEPALFANAGETMAETYTRIDGVPTISVDIEYTDVWTDESVRAKDAPFEYSYSDLSSTPPVEPGCVTDWNASCRITVNYEMHIHPIWAVPRVTLDVDGNVLVDDTCTTCHSPRDAAGAAQVPASQLDLSDGISPDEADHFNSYRELMFNDNEQEVVNDVLIDRLVQQVINGVPQFQVDGNGDLVLDVDGNPIPVLVTVNVNPSLNVGGANASGRFLDRFAPGGTHDGRLTGAELKLISEWLDIGGQYYNNPFAVPQ